MGGTGLPPAAGRPEETAETAAPVGRPADADAAAVVVEAAGAPVTATATAPTRAELAARLAPAPAGSKAAPAPKLGFAARFWRDFGVNPVAMARRAFVDRIPTGGTKIEGGKRAEALGIDAFRADLRTAIEGLKADDGKGLSDEALKAFEKKVSELAGRYGVDVQFKTGAPTTSWGDFPTVEVERSGGGAHELVHAVQLAIGGVAALSTAAAEKIARERGRPTESTADILATIPKLTDAERKKAFDEVVKPMEEHAYALFEHGAFGAVGFGGSRVRDLEKFRAALLANVDGFCDAYALAAAPELDLGAGAKGYAMLGHVARTHGETAVLGLLGAGAYYGVAAAAMAVNPLFAVAAVAPLLYPLWKFIRG
jgi:hypothetical protein